MSCRSRWLACSGRDTRFVTGSKLAPGPRRRPEAPPQRTKATRLALREPTYVADRPVYQLALIPDTRTSLVTEIVIGVDAATGLPLKVAVHTRSGTVAIESKFTSIDFKRPAASNLA